jgi:hypothetical protein
MRGSIKGRMKVEDFGGNLYVQASDVNYNTIESILGGKTHDMLISAIPLSLSLFLYD